MKPDRFGAETLIEYGRIAVRTRWLVVLVGAAVLPILRRNGLFLEGILPLAILGGIVVLYNGILQVIFRRWHRRGELPPVERVTRLRIFASFFDLTVAILLLYFTGGASSPLFPLFLLIFLFVGVVSLSLEPLSQFVYAMAGLALLFYGEQQGWWPRFRITYETEGVLATRPRLVWGVYGYWALLLAGAGVLLALIRRELLERERRLEQRRRQIRRAQSLQGKVLECLPVGVVVFGAGGRIIHMNPAAAEILEITDEEDHRNLLRLERVAANGLLDYLEWVVAGERIELNDFPVRSREGERRWLRVVAIPPGEEQPGILVVQDVTEERAREERERAFQEKLLEADKFASLGQLASGVAHELNNPLTAIVSAAQYIQHILKKEQRPDPKVVEQRLQQILQQGKRIEILVRNLLAYARPRQAVASQLDLRQLVLELLSFSRYELERGDVRLEVELAEELPPFLGNRMELQHMILNLLTNARQALEACGGGRIRLVIGVREEEHGQRFLVVEVSDTGPGIPPDVVERMFEPFYTTKGEQGTGLGLAIVHAIVERYGGEIDVETEPGAGTTFRITLPFLDELPDYQSGESTFSPYR